MEIWKDIKCFEGIYKISNTGKVKSMERYTSTGKTIKGRILKQSIKQNGYKKITLSNKGNKKTIEIHRLVALAFIDNPDDKSDVNHIDGNKLNNSVDNLEWNTRLENIRHSWDNGLRTNQSQRRNTDPTTGRFLKKII